MLHTANLVVHIGAGIGGVIVGMVALASTKGAGLHRRAGRIYAVLAGVVVATAVVGVVGFRAFPALTAATFAVGYQVASSLRTLARKTRGPAPFDTALAAAALAATIAMLVTMGQGNTSWSPAIGYPILGTLAAITTYDLSRVLWRATWIRGAWRLDHGLKMTNALFGMLAAGTGNLAPQLQPWSQVGPSIIGGVVVVALVIRHRGGVATVSTVPR